MTRFALTALAAGSVLAALAPAASAAPKFRIQHFAWEATLSYAESNSAADPANVQDERGETLSSFDYLTPPSGPRHVRIRRRPSVFHARQAYTVETEATWREDEGFGFVDKSCGEVTERDNAGSVAFRARRKRVVADWTLPIALFNCGPGLFDDRHLDDSVESDTTQFIPRRRFRDRHVRMAISGHYPLRSTDNAVAGRLDWKASLRLVRTRRPG